MRRPPAPKVNALVFHAIADPTRREIIHLLAVGTAPLSMAEIAERFESTRQAVAKHISILNRAGLVSLERHGREKLCRLQVKQLETVGRWVRFYEQFWEQRLVDLGNYLDREK